MGLYYEFLVTVCQWHGCEYQFYEASYQASEILFHQLIVEHTNANTVPENSKAAFNTYML